MKITKISPSKALLTEIQPLERLELRKLLSYANTAKAYLVKRHVNNHVWKTRNFESWDAKYEELKAAVNTTLVFNDGDGDYVRPGSIPYILEKMDAEVVDLCSYPVPKPIAWARKLPFNLYPYQRISADKLVVVKHGNVELATGAGKTAILMQICKDTGFTAAIIVPSKSIFLELVEKFEHHFGKPLVGKFGNGTKKIGKRFTICIGDSLTNIKKGTPEWDWFSNLQMVIVDESHSIACETLEEVTHGVLAQVPYRLFLSGTQLRGSGDTKLLQSIIGRTVHELSTQEAVAGKFICPHEFRIVRLPSSNPNFQTGDALEMKRVHFLNNTNILKFAAKLANAEAKLNNRGTLILVDELSQVAYLAKLMEVPFVLAHSEARKERLIELQISKVKPQESVEKFNKGEAKVIIGTSCIGTGTNLFPTHNVINLQGGSSEIKTRQASVGRGIRFLEANPFKIDCPPKDRAIIWDFDVTGIKIMEIHLKKRIAYYEMSGAPIKYLKL